MRRRIGPMSDLPVLVIGAGPQGLAAAGHPARRGDVPPVLEAGRWSGAGAAVLGDRVRYGVRVTGLSRRGRDRLVSAGRDGQPFTVHLVDRDGVESRIEARAVIDASGTWQ